MTMERTSATNKETKATHMDGKVARHLKAIYKTSCLKYVLKMAMLWAKTDCNYLAPWKNSDVTPLHSNLMNTPGRPWQLRISYSSERRCQQDQTRKKTTTILSADETTLVSICSKQKRNPKSSATNRYKCTQPTTTRYTWLSILVDSV